MMSSASESMIPLHLDMFRWLSLGQDSTMTRRVLSVRSQHPEMSKYDRLGPQHLRMGSRDFSVTWTHDASEREETFEKALSFPSSTRSSWSATEFASLFRCRALHTSTLLTSFPQRLHTLDRCIIEVGQFPESFSTSMKIRRSWSSSRSFSPGTVVVTDSAKSTYWICWASAGDAPLKVCTTLRSFLALARSSRFCWLRTL
mmetsp:Transcript_4520/g.15850  ORF Transcript_4520/g.15850 Transcript_4520/m.15850 type:complete len:201 (+) Transcript_4520:597-1199(+)